MVAYDLRNEEHAEPTSLWFSLSGWQHEPYLLASVPTPNPGSTLQRLHRPGLLSYQANVLAPPSAVGLGAAWANRRGGQVRQERALITHN